jgi:hypothetical protein
LRTCGDAGDCRRQYRHGDSMRVSRCRLRGFWCSLLSAHARKAQCVALLHSLSGAVARCGRPFDGKQGGGRWRWQLYVLAPRSVIILLRAYLVRSTLLPRASCAAVCDGAGWMALPAERWVADVRRSYSHHLGSSGIATLHMPAGGRSVTCRRRGMTFSRSVCMLCCAEY